MTRAPSKKTKKPKVAVLMATYNGEKFIEDQLLSIIYQHSVDVSIFISDDCSSDHTLEIIHSIIDKHKNIKVLSNGIKYGSAGKNFISLITSDCFKDFDFVALADQDDIWLPNKLIRSIRCISEKNVDAYSSNVIAFWDKDIKIKPILKSKKMRKYDHYFEAAGPGCTYVFTSKSLINFSMNLKKSKDYLNKVYQHDCLLYFFYRQYKMKWFIDDNFTLLYRQHSFNDFGVSSTLKGSFKRLTSVMNGKAKKQVLSHFDLFNLDNKNVESRMWLLYNVKHLRRSLKDRALLFLMLLFFIY